MSSLTGVREAAAFASTESQAFAHCEGLARAHYENFPVGSILIPKAKRKYVYAIYAFARIADDYADEDHDKGVTTGERLDRLEDWGQKLEDCAQGRATNPVFVALRATIKDLDIPLDLFRDLLSAFTQDVVKRRYNDFSEVLDYCRRSANPIGRLILLLFGYRDPALDRLSDKICTALQLTNFWQDVSVDIEKDRIYLPLDEMRKYGVTEDEIRARRFSKRYADLLRFQVERTREMFADGRDLCEMVTGRLRYELRLTWLGGMRILEKIEEGDYDTLGSRPAIEKRDKVALITRAVLMKL